MPGPTRRARPRQAAPRTGPRTPCWVHTRRPAGPAPIAGRRPARTFLACSYSSVFVDRSMGCLMSSTRSSSWCERLRWRAGRPLDVALDVVARAIAADEGPAELDRRVVGGERDTFDQERGRAAALAQQAGLASSQEDRFQGLPSADDGRVVTGRHDLVQRGVLQVAGEETRKPLGREMDLLEEIRLTPGESEPLEIERRGPRLEAQRRRDGHGRGLGA